MCKINQSKAVICYTLPYHEKSVFLECCVYKRNILKEMCICFPIFETNIIKQLTDQDQQHHHDISEMIEYDINAHVQPEGFSITISKA